MGLHIHLIMQQARLRARASEGHDKVVVVVEGVRVMLPLVVVVVVGAPCISQAPSTPTSAATANHSQKHCLCCTGPASGGNWCATAQHLALAALVREALPKPETRALHSKGASTAAAVGAADTRLLCSSLMTFFGSILRRSV